MIEDVKIFIRECSECQFTKNLKVKPGMMIPIQSKISKPFEMIGMDIAGPLPVTSKGNRFFLLIIDYFTGWTECIALSCIDSKTIMSAVLEQWIYKYGIPNAIITDNGSSFMSRLSKSIYEKLNIIKKTTSIYHPQSDGKAEKSIGIIKTIIKKNLINKTEEWDTLLPLAAFAIRSAGKPASGRPSPAKALFGFDINSPLDMINDAEEVIDGNKNSDYYHRRKIIWKSIIHQMQLYAFKYSTEYNRNRKEINYQVGDLVLYKERHISGLLPKYKKKYVIEKVLGNAVLLKNLDGTPSSMKGTVNINDIKMFYEKPISSSDNELSEDEDLEYNEVIHDPYPTIHVSINDCENDIIIRETFEQVMNNEDYDYNHETESEGEEIGEQQPLPMQNSDIIDNIDIIDNNNIIDNQIIENEQPEETPNWIPPINIKRNNINQALEAHNIQYAKKSTFYDKLNMYEAAYKQRGE
jgi:transposase InsO family protein